MTLDEALLDAHARDDRTALVTLYTRAADTAESIDATCFFLTQAYIFALETGDAASKSLHDRLRAFGRV
ncbi:hypothetical protein [Cognatiyoonia sp. IB215182]|uniref:hypothetical protein n=1 Tax=Cognatiyoonia sp. IB215182 TaxID=3097353 RepID=UPI002A0CB9D7|nr:hypothetical protein [Cognatiyoonia sp. IB215182]MDX8352191.1 hypothetical protein [Cognatiyoonia sp. IB215182]